MKIIDILEADVFDLNQTPALRHAIGLAREYLKILSDGDRDFQSRWLACQNIQKQLEVLGYKLEFVKNKAILKHLGSNQAISIKLHEGSYGRYWCSTDKKWKQRQGPKQHRKVKESVERLPQGTQIFVDLDGVCADFFTEYAKLAGIESGNYRDIPPAKTDPTLNKMVGTDFFNRLPMFSTAPELINMVVKAAGTYKVLSSPLRGDHENSAHWKKIWVARHLHPAPAEVIIAANKAKYARNPDGTPNILIDDRGSNISAWEAAGGIGIKYQADEDSLGKIAQGLERAQSIISGEEPHEPQKLSSLDRGKMIQVDTSGDREEEPVSENWADLNTAHHLAAELQADWEDLMAARAGPTHEHHLQSLAQSVIDLRQQLKDLGFSYDVRTRSLKKFGSTVENFADGKHPGRKGLAKRSGVDTKASVSSLRKTAKHSTGEKARMAHWLANMKAGKAKHKNEDLDHDTPDSSIHLDPKRGDYEIRNYHKLDKYLKELVQLIAEGQKKNSEKYGKVAAGLLTLKYPYMARLNRAAADGKRQHAESAVIEDFLAEHGEIPEGSVLITTLSPCNKHMDEREGPACADIVNHYGIEKVYCGYIDPTQHGGSEDHRHYTLIETTNHAIRTVCQKIADTFLDEVEEDAAGVGIVTKQNTTADVGPGTLAKNLKAFKL